MSEFSFIDAVTQRWPGAPGVYGPGDDAVLLEGTDLVVSSDAAVEGVHFRKSWPVSAADIGSKVLAQAVYDLWAMGAQVHSAQLQIAQGPEWDDMALLECVGGMAHWGQALSLSGGDLVRCPGPTMLALTVFGCLHGQEPWMRSGARPGDTLVVTRTTGLGALALHSLEHGHCLPQAQAFTAPPHLDSLIPRLQSLGAVHAAIDISDGLGADASHMARASNCSLRFEQSALESSLLEQCTLPSDLSALDLVWNGGEAGSLLLALDPAKVAEVLNEFPQGQVVGQVRDTPPGQAIVMDGEGRALDLPTRGYRHRAHDSVAP